MKLISLTVHNFMPFKGETKISFPSDSTRNVMIIFGENMRGKTSLLNAIRWAFYGKAFGRHLREIELHELHNKEAAAENDWTMECRIEFEAEGSRYDLRRRATKRPMVAKPSRPEDFEMIASLQKDGAAISGHLYESEINRFVPEQISRFFLFDGELLQEYESLLIEGSDQGKRIKDSIEQVLGVPTLINGRDEIYTILKASQKTQSKDLIHIQGLEAQAEKQAMWQSRQESYENDLKELRFKLEGAKNEREKLDDELDKVDAIHQAKLRYDFLKGRQSTITEDQKKLTEEKLLLLKDAWKDLLNRKLSLKQTLLLEEQTKVARRINETGKVNSRLSDLRSYLDTSSCPLCGQGMAEENRAKARNEILELESKIQGYPEDSNSLSKISSELNEISGLIKAGAAPKIRSIDTAMRKLDVELTRIENEMEQIVKQIQGHDTADIARKRAHHTSLIREEVSIERDISDRIEKIEVTRKELAVIAIALQSYPEARASRSTALVKLCSSLEKIFDQSIERLRDNLRKHVEAKATETFLKLTTQKKYKGLEINVNYGLTILDENNHPVNVRSAGAEQIVALSLIDGLARTGRAEGPVVMDTPFGRLDLKHRDNILSHLPSTTGQLVLLVHDGEIRRETDLAPIASRIGAFYEIKEVNPRHSKIERVTS